MQCTANLPSESLCWWHQETTPSVAPKEGWGPCLTNPSLGVNEWSDNKGYEAESNQCSIHITKQKHSKEKIKNVYPHKSWKSNAYVLPVLVISLRTKPRWYSFLYFMQCYFVHSCYSSWFIVYTFYWLFILYNNSWIQFNKNEKN